MAEPATVRETARLLGLDVSTVQKDVRRGCGGIVRPGAPGRGNGALLDVDEYRNWRAQRAGTAFDLECERDRGFSLLCEVALRTYQEAGGVTGQSKALAADVLLNLLGRFAARYLHDDSRLPEETRTIIHVLQNCRTR